MTILLNVLIGVGLAATCGFRIFVPLLVLGLAGLNGYVKLGSGFEWLATYPAVIALGVATFVEVLAYFFPYVDNLLTTISTPVGVIAGVLVTAAVMTDVSPLLQWSLAIIAGGGAATATSMVSNGVHHGSTAASAGIINPFVSAVESVGAFLISLLSIAAPIIAIIVIGLLLYLLYRTLIKIRFTLKNRRGTYKIKTLR